MEITFRKAIESDLDDALSMIQDFYQIDGYPFDAKRTQSNFHEIISTPSLGVFWILETKEVTIGYLILTFGYSFEYGGRDAFIDEFYFKEEFRGKGYGTEILNQLDSKAKELGIKAIHLEVESTNEAGSRLYEKTGFQGNNRKLLTKKINQ